MMPSTQLRTYLVPDPLWTAALRVSKTAKHGE